MPTHLKQPQESFPTVLARQQAFNRRTRLNTSLFEPHRQRVTGAIVQSSQQTGGRLCILGAGNANDLDLPILAGAYSEIHLVDLDTEALQQAAERFSGPAATLCLHGGVDLSGIASQLDDLSDPHPAGNIDKLIAAAQHPPPPNIPHPFDVVASTCILTQLMNAAVAAVGESAPGLIELLAAIRIGHLRLLTAMVAPGGSGLLFTDIASSDDTPDIATHPDPARLAANLTRRKQLFAGIDLQKIEADIRADATIAPRIDSLTSLGAWPWRISKKRTFLVAGLAFQAAYGEGLGKSAVRKAR